MNPFKALHTSASILIVGCDADNLLVLNGILQETRYFVRSVDINDSLFPSIFSQLPDLILVDIGMPRKTGYEVCRELKAESRSREIPVLYLCPLENVIDAVRGMKHGAADYIVQPFDRKEVLSKIGTHIALNQLHQQLIETSIELQQSLSNQEHAESNLSRNEQQCTLLLSLIQSSCTTRQELLEQAVEGIAQITESPVAYLHLVREDQNTIELGVWSKAVSRRCQVTTETHYELAAAGIWADCIRQRKAVIHNDYESVPGRKGLPEGHFPVRRHMSIPIFIGDKIMAVAGVGNKTAPYNEADGRQLVLLVRSIWEIVQRREAEQALQESESRLREAQRIAHLGRWEHDLVNDAISWSEEIYRILGFDPEKSEASYDAFLHVVHPEDRDLVKYAYSLFLQTKSAYNLVHRLLLPDGSLRYVKALCRQECDAEGRALRSMGILQDITELKTVEEELKQARVAADAANRAKGEFLARMSHEIRTPMNAIIGLSHLVMQTELNQRQGDYLRKIHYSALSLLEIINDILDFSKIESGMIELEAIPFSLDEVLENLIGIVGIKAEEKGVELLIDTGNEVPRALIGDALRLRQILVNLVDNAVKFTESGEVVVAVRVVGKHGAAVRLRFSVTDTGIGMTAEQILRLFQPFSQADGSMTRKYGGSGLGLVISQKLVELLGGKLEVNSRIGKGSDLSFAALFKKQGRQKRKFHVPIHILRGMRVLIVDDNETSLSILRDMMDSFSYEVVTANSGLSALQAVKEAADAKPFDLILLDWMMPEMDGVETAKRIRHIRNLPTIPRIIMLTGYGREEIRQQAITVGVNAFLLKPVTPSMLFDTIMEVSGHPVPRHPHSADLKYNAHGNWAVLKGAHILLVEDNSINQQVVRELLENTGLRVTTADNGYQAIDKMSAVLSDNEPLPLPVSDFQFDAILMDIQMPDMDGYETTRRIRQRAADIPIIAITAHAMKGEREKCLAAGMNDYVSKPIDPPQLFEALAKWIPSRSDTGALSEPESHSSLAGALTRDMISGMDFGDGLNRLAGNQALYHKLLIEFLTKFADAGIRLKSLLEENKFEQARTLVHTIKGTSGNLGANSLATIAGLISQAIAAGRSPQPIAALASLFSEELDKVVHDITKLALEPEAGEHRTNSNPPKIVATREKMIGILQDLIAHLQTRMPKQCEPDLQRISNTKWPYSYRAPVAELVQRTRKYQYKEALALADNLIAKLEA